MVRENGQANQTKKVRLEDVARAAAISLSAASMALADHPRISDATKLRVRQISRDMGYRPPREQAGYRRRSRVPGAMQRLGFLLIGNRLQDDVNVSLLHALTTEANAQQVRIELGAIEQFESHDEVAQRMLQFARELDGILVCGLVDEALLQGLRAADAAHVVVGQVLSEPHRHGVVPGVHVVAPDDMGMGYVAGMRLLQGGASRIAFVTDAVHPNMCHDRWLAGLRLAHSAMGKVHADALAITAGRESGQVERAIESLLALREPPDALVLPQTRLAAGLLPALAQTPLRLTRDNAVVGGSEEMLRRHNLLTGPSLITNTEALAAAAVDRLLQLCRNPQTPPGVILLPHQESGFASA